MSNHDQIAKEIGEAFPVCAGHNDFAGTVKILSDKMDQVMELLKGNTVLFQLKTQAAENRIRLLSSVGLILFILTGMYIRPEIAQITLFNVVGYSSTGWLFGEAAFALFKDKGTANYNKAAIIAPILGALISLATIARAIF